jgi:hypothetical protein
MARRDPLKYLPVPALPCAKAIAGEMRVATKIATISDRVTIAFSLSDMRLNREKPTCSVLASAFPGYQSTLASDLRRERSAFPLFPMFNVEREFRLRRNLAHAQNFVLSL